MTGALRLALAVLVVYGAVVALLFVAQRSLLYPASTQAVSAAQAGLDGFRDLVLKTSDGESVVAWWRPPEPGRAVVLYFHGNGGGLWNRRFRVRALAEGGRGVLIVSYRGYSGSTGAPTEEGLRLDARAAYDWLNAAYEADRIALYGESLGTGVAVRLAAERPVGGLILDAPYTSTADVAARLYWWAPVALLMRDQFRSIDVVGGVKAPILVLHGEADRVIPIAFGERLFQAAPEPKRFVRLGGGHEENLERGIGPIRDFLGEVEARAPQPDETQRSP